VHRATVHASGDTVIVAQDRGISYLTTDLKEVRAVPLTIRPMALVALENARLAIAQSSGGKPQESAASAFTWSARTARTSGRSTLSRPMPDVTAHTES
jgi:hypothetical protein